MTSDRSETETEAGSADPQRFPPPPLADQERMVEAVLFASASPMGLREIASRLPAGCDPAEALRLTWRAQDGLAADLTAPTGRMEGQQIHLSGGVRVTTSDGWAMTVPQVDTDLSADRMLGTGGLTGFAPFGRLDANQMEVTRSPNGDYLLNLTGDVRLVYQP